MPKLVDTERRRKEILRATTELIAERGITRVSFRVIAERLGGSTTLITHYYSSQADLLNDLATHATESWEEEVAQLQAGIDDPYQRLRTLLIWMLPTTKAGLIEEQACVNLLAHQLEGADHHKIFNAWEKKLRRMLNEHTRELVVESAVDEIVDLLRVAIAGVTISVVKDPGKWPARRQIAILDKLIHRLRLGVG